MKFLDVPQSGSWAGNTHSHNRAGQYRRNRRSPVQPVGTGRRAFIRSTFGAASTSWGGLTDAQRNAWDSFAADHPVVDSLGQSLVLTGAQMLNRVYVSCLNVGLSAPTVPPTILDVPDLSGAVVTFSVATGVSISGITGIDAAMIAVAFSRPMSPGRTFNKTFWQPLGAAGYKDVEDLPYTLTTAVYAAEFGTPLVGQRVFVRITPLSEQGWNGTPLITSVLVSA